MRPRWLTVRDLAFLLVTLFVALLWTRCVIFILLLYSLITSYEKTLYQAEMSDPWDVYVSFMKMNGVPLLPPVLTKERRSEMQYYQLLAKEVESRISRLTPYCVQTNGDSEQDKDTTSDSTVCDSPPNTQQQEDVKSVQDLAAHIESALKSLVGEKTVTPSKKESVIKLDENQSKSSERTKDTKLVYNFTTLPEKEDKEEEPEKDGSCSLINSKGVMAKGKKISFGASPSPDREAPVSPTDKNVQDKSAAMSKKRMSGSLMDLSHTSPERKPHIPRLQRQNSYTLLAPSPQLLAHLQSRSQQAGPDTKLSSSDSQCSPKQKRRNWDLETAKVKWSDMALELKQHHGVPKLISKSSKAEKPIVTEKVGADKPKYDRQSQTIVRAKSSPGRNRLSSLTSRTVMRTDVKVEAAGDKSTARRVSRPATPSPPNGKHRSPPTNSPSPEHSIPPQYIIGEKEDPSRKVRDLLETIQKQQIMQMASLVEKQKREQMMLQQVFEEQNMYLSRQIKNICPEIEIRNVSLDAPTRDFGVFNPYYGGLAGVDGLKGTASTYVYHYDGMLPPRPTGATDDKNIKYPPFTRNIITQTRPKKQSAKSPKSKKGKERPSKAAESSDDIEFMAEPVRCPVDDLGELQMADECNILRGSCVRPAAAKRPCSPAACDKHGSVSFSRGPSKPKEDKEELECELEGDFGLERPRSSTDLQQEDELLDERERENQRECEEQRKREEQRKCEEQRNRERAAATCIVAHARGYLTRRLMRTAKVRALVQTIRDALLCALQLHQDRDGVRGADVDLHRRLIQQITAACYAVHETVITNPIAQKMAIIAADRVRLKALAAKQPTPLGRRASPTASPLLRRQSPTSQPPQRRQSPASPNLHHRASHTAATENRRGSSGPPSPTLQRRGSPTCPLATRQSSPTPPAPLVQRRPSPMAAQTARPPPRRIGVMSQSYNGGGTYTVPPYSQPAPPAQLMSKSTHDAGITVRVGRGHNGQQKRWL